MSADRRLAERLAVHLPAMDLGARQGLLELEERIAAWLAEARAAWPEVELEDDVALAYVAARLRNSEDRAAALAEANWKELYLACACSRGDPAALRAFDQHYLKEIPSAIAHLSLSRSDVEEIVQSIREKLFVARDGAAPRIDQYAGGGSLRGLVKVMAVRSAISIRRKEKREASDPEEEILRLPSAVDPELDSVKGELRAHFQQAFERAVAELSPRERNLLRLHLLEGVTLAQLATSYSVHRATVTRWLGKARRALLDATRRQLEAEVGSSVGELDSFVGLVKSRLDLSLTRLLKTGD